MLLIFIGVVVVPVQTSMKSPLQQRILLLKGGGTASPKMDVPLKAFEILVDLEGMESIPYQDGNGRSVGYGFATVHLTPEELELIENVENVKEEKPMRF